ncbi:MAG: amidohydrolase [Thalassobius sp.]|nr:amidohydrolase [Thalassovita sp.]
MKIFYFLIFIGFISACNTPKNEKIYNQDLTLIKDVNVLDVRTGDILKNKFILIGSGEVIDILDEQPESKEIVTVIEASGNYLMPGLAEMHAHIPSPDWGRENYEETLFLYLSNGVTTIRGMLGHPLHLELIEKALKNEILSPRIITSSPSFNGNTVPTPEDAVEKVVAYKEAGYDFLKLHPGIKREVFDTLVKTAKLVDIPYAGHVSIEVGIRHALESGYATVDHVDGFIEGLVPEEKGLDPASNGFFGYNFTNEADTNLISELVEMTNTYGVWVVPTQSLFMRWFSPTDPEQLALEEEMKYMPKRTLESWVNSKKNLISDPEFSAEKWEAYNAIRKSLIYQLNKKGHGLLLGSDAPQVFNVPGFSIQHELKGMLDAGLTPLEAIQIGTLNPAKYLNMEGKLGEVAIGASADFIMLEANPIENMDVLKTPAGVMVRGQWLSRETLDKKLAEIARSSEQ